MRSIFRSLISVAATLAAGLPAHAATTVDFDDFTLSSHTDSFSENGWTFEAETSGPDPVNLAVEETGRQSDYAGDLVVSFGFPNVDGSPINLVSIGTSDGEAFKLVGLSLGDGFGNANLRIEAYRDGSPVGYAAEEVDIFDSVEQVNFTGWDNLDEIQITNSSGSPDLNFDVDDMEIAEAVPEPAAFGLALIGELTLLARRRR